MTPEQLAYTGTNTQLEPLRRAIEASVPSSNTTFDYNEPRPRRPSSTPGPFAAPVGQATSLENPLLRLTEEEYRTLRRYQEERALPDRFLGQVTAQRKAFFAPKVPRNPVFQTTSQEYGKYQPNVHTMPYSYHGINTKFTALKTVQGNYRNHSLNI